MKPRLLDLFCGAGGAAVGYHRAGFDVVGVDIRPQPRYPFEFVQADALAFMRQFVREIGTGPLTSLPITAGFDAVHASPPCQAFSALNRAVGNQASHEDLIPPTRALLRTTGLPYVIENVPGAPLEDVVTICGVSCGLEVIRHRCFETNWLLMVPPCVHKPGGAADGTYVMFGGRSPRAEGRRVPPRASEREWRDCAGLDFMPIRDSRQAIPPAYTELIGYQLMSHVRARSAA